VPTADPWGTFEPALPNAAFALIGTPNPVGGPFTAGTVTVTSPGNPGNDWEVAIGNSVDAAIGQLVYDSSASLGGAYFWIDSLSGSGSSLTATVTMPFSGTAVTTVTWSVPPTFSTINTGDTLQLYTVPTIYADAIQPSVGANSNVSGVGTPTGTSWFQMVDFGDTYGNGYSQTVVGGNGNVSLSSVRSDVGLILRYNFALVNAPHASHSVGSWFSNGLLLAAPDLQLNGGAINTLGGSCIIQDFMYFTWNPIVHGNTVIYSGSAYAAGMHIPSGATVSIEPGASLQAVNEGADYASPLLWGAGTVTPYQGGSFINRSGSGPATALGVNTMLLTSNSITTGCAPLDGGTGSPPCGIPLTVANWTTYGALIEPLSGARFTN
jgi:hypothetical protein